MKRTPLAEIRRRFRSATQNALELARFGRLGESVPAPFDVVARGPHHRLRKYATTEAHGRAIGDAPVALLVPPLMVTAEIYDMAPDTSAVSALGSLGVVPFLIDFGAPEREAGGMTRTLDDHVRAVVQAVDDVRAMTGKNVHLLGYSQGGMFCYQAAAYRRSEGIQSIVTFGSPVDIHRQLPAIRTEIAEKIVALLEPAISGAMKSIEGLPGALTSVGFKLVSTRKELSQRLEFLGLLHDRKALVRREARRRFLGGEGFVAWPGPALRAFVDEFVVHNRLVSGGFTIDGRSVTLADITSPVLCFIGQTDEIARPAAVRAIEGAAPLADLYFMELRAGHFGLVVGRTAMSTTWPTVVDWIRWKEGAGPKPAGIRAPDSKAGKVTAAPSAEDKFDPDSEFDVEVELLLDTVAKGAKAAWKRIGDAAASAGDALDAVRYQEPRLRKLASLGPNDRVGPGLELSHRAAETPDATFFLWRGRVFTYREADQRITSVTKGLYQVGVRSGDKVGVVMGSRPSFLSMMTALNRLGAIAVIAPPEADEQALREAFEAQGVTRVAADPDHAARLRKALDRTMLVLGGGGHARVLGEGLLDMEAIDPEGVVLPSDFMPNPGLARDPALVLLRPSEGGTLRAAQITHHRWALSAYGAAAACTLKPSDTVFSAIPLHHPTGVLASAGSAIVAGARLALGEPFDANRFVVDVRRTGATVVFYAGEMLRPLLFEPASRGDRSLPVRLFAGSGMRRDLAVRLEERFGVGTMEFYASTTDRVILANAAGRKPGAIGRPLPGSAPIAIAKLGTATADGRRDRVEAAKDSAGRFLAAGPGEEGILAVRLTGERESEAPVQDGREGRFGEGDLWKLTGDVVTRDGDGDFRFIDSLSGFVQTAGGPVSTRALEDVLYGLSAVELAAVYPAAKGLAAAVVARRPIAARRVTEVLQGLPAHARPARVFVHRALPLTEGFRPSKSVLQKLEGTAEAIFELAADGTSYVLLPNPRAAVDAPLATA